MRILFVCKHNRFRSKVAEAIFNNFSNKNKAKSRGLIEDIDVHKNVVRAMKEQGLKLKNKKSRKISKEDIKWSNLIVVVADNVKHDFGSKKVLYWNIPDTSAEDYKGIKEKINKIKRKVLDLIYRIENKKI